jgi:uncharacterized delta-60 repeat protein
VNFQDYCKFVFDIKVYMRKLTLILLLCLAGKNAFSQPGTLDTSYASNGRVLTSYTPANFLSDYSVLQQDDYVVMMGRYGVPASGIAQIGISRHKADGTIDTGFGTNGLVIINVNNRTYGKSIVLQQDGKIVISGYIQNPSTNVSLLVARLNPNGVLDSTFGTNGIAVINNNLIGNSVKIQPDNKIVIGGNCGLDFGVSRLNVDGSLDDDFGFNGLVTTTINSSSNSSQINALNITSDGKIIASGWAYLNPINKCFCTVRYDTSGNIDTGFGINGRVITDLDSSAAEEIMAQAIQADGKIVVTGNKSLLIVVARYNIDGGLDTSFGTNGISTNTFGNSCLVHSMLIQPDNKIVIVGESFSPDNKYFIARYDNNGLLDNTFNSNGYNLLSFGPNNNQFNSVLLQQDGKLIATGFTQIENDIYTVIARFNSGLLNTNQFELDRLKLFPNPTEGIVMFDNTVYDIKKVTVLNYLGQQVQKTFDCPHGDVRIDLSGLMTGTYILQMEGENAIFNVRVIKK